ncbi:MAG: GumC family protein, partial [Candidatus Auribacterota bacterium]|nr:GumC family protein [Candidatus Auribacterota bacterium]
MTVSRDIDFNLREKFYIIQRRKWVLIASVVVIFTVVTIGNFTATPLYRATTRLRIEPRMPNIVPFKELYSISGHQLDYYNTQYKILKSRSLARKVMESLPPDRIGELTAGSLLQIVSIKPIAQSQLVDIIVVSPDPELAALISNTWASQFIRLTIDSKLKAVQSALSQLTQQLEEQSENVKSARQKLLAYKEQERIVSLEDVQKELDRLTEAYSTTKMEREEKELLLKHLKKYSDQEASLETFPEIRYHSIIMQLKNRLVQLQSTLAEYSQRYKSKHPRMLQLQAEIKTVKNSLQTEITKIIQSLKNEHELSRANEARILADLEKQKTLAFIMERKLAAIDDLKTKVTIKREGQQALLSRVNETSMTKGIEITNIRVVDEAEVPLNPFKP